jgi:hypothetical protein
MDRSGRWHPHREFDAGDDADFSFHGMRARRSVLLNCLRSFAQISLCDAQSAVPLKIIFRGSRALDRVRAGR